MMHTINLWLDANPFLTFLIALALCFFFMWKLININWSDDE